MSNKRKTLADLQAEQGQNPEELEGTTGEQTPAPEEEANVEDAAVDTAPAAPTEAAPEQGASAISQSAATAPAMVSISATELTTLRADASEWNQNKGKFAVLNTWYDNMKAAGVTHDRDASEAKPTTKRASKGTARAIAIAERAGA